MNSKILSMINSFVNSLTAVSTFKDKRLSNRCKFILQEMLLAGSSILTSITRNRIETEKKFSCQYINIQRFFNNTRWSYQKFFNKLLYLTCSYLKDNQVIAFDFSEMIKPKGKKLEYLDMVHDGSTDSVKPGYWISCAAAKVNGYLLPLYFHTFSMKAKGAIGKIEEILKAVNLIYQRKKQFTAVFDREFDNTRVFQHILSLKGVSFVIRAKNQRKVTFENGHYGKINSIEESFFSQSKLLSRKSKKEKNKYEYAFTSVKINNVGKVYVVGSRSILNSKKKWYLYTNIPVKNYKQAKQIIEYYRQRWQIETTIRTVKQEMKIEKFLLRKYEAIQKMTLVSSAVIFFTTKFLLNAGKKILQYTKERAEIFTKNLNAFSVMLALRKIYTMPLSEQEKGLLLAASPPTR
jgi:hypothetical protein